MDIATTRAAQEIQAAMVIAKRFPRDETQAYGKIMKACRRIGLAEGAIYSYPRGGTKVEGPSIRMAEALAQSWGNIDFGIIELSQANGESEVMSYAWDLETNSRQTKIFTVPHERHTRNGSKRLTDPRDIYEMVANQGARRLRACILGVIPGDIVDDAVRECRKTLAGDNSVPLADRVRKMADAFLKVHGVTKEMLEARLGHTLESTSENELVDLRGIYVSIKDGMSERKQWFDPAGSAAAAKQTVQEKIAAAAASESSAPADPSPEPVGASASASDANQPGLDEQPWTD